MFAKCKDWVIGKILGVLPKDETELLLIKYQGLKKELLLIKYQGLKKEYEMTIAKVDGHLSGSENLTENRKLSISGDHGLSDAELTEVVTTVFKMWKSHGFILQEHYDALIADWDKRHAAGESDAQ